MTALQRVIGQPAFASPEGEVESFDLSLLDEQITPNDLFFIRSHFSPPAINDAWNISICGEASKPYQVSVKDLPNFAQFTVGTTMECDENPVGGGLVSTAEWRGASLGALIAAAQPSPSTQFVRLWGADHDYAQSLPLLKATSADTLLAYQMNGDALPLTHGGPARAIVPGWYGTYSVKWLSRVELLAEDRDGNHLRQIRGGRSEPIRDIQVKSAFARPLDGAIISGQRFIVRGVAWAGEKSIAKVELSTDGGKSWKAAQLLDRPQHYMWIRWQFFWKIPASGPYELVVGATDSDGHSQPAQRDPARLDDYEHNERQRVRVEVIWAK